MRLRITLTGLPALLLCCQIHAAESELFTVEVYDMGHVRPFMNENQFVKWPSMIDIDADGDLDVLVTSWDFFTDEKDPSFVMLNDSTGHFTYDENGSSAPDPSVGSQHWSLIEDFNNDGKKDIYFLGMGNEGGEELVNWWTGTHNQLFLHTGAEGLVDNTAASLIEERRTVIHSATAGDIDGDGDIDIFNAALGLNGEGLAALGEEPLGSFFWINDGNAIFTSSDDRALPIYNIEEPDAIQNVQDSLLVDVDQDGDLDLLLTMPTEGTPTALLSATGPAEPAFLILINDGTGHFQTPAVASAPNRNPPGPDRFSYNLVAGDVNNDGLPDLILSVVGFDLYDGSLQLMLNNGDGSFSDATANIGFETPWQLSHDAEGGYVLRVFLEDFNGDDSLDILSLGSSYKPKLHFNNGDGTFTEVTSILGDFPDASVVALTVGDIDGDGDIDIISPETGCGDYCPSFTILRNNSDPPVTDNPGDEAASFANGVLTIPVLQVGNTFYQLDLNLTSEDPVEFQLGDYQVLTDSSNSNPSTFVDNVLTIPELCVGENCYRVELLLMESEVVTLRLQTAEPI